MIKALLRNILPNDTYERVRQIYWRLWDAWHNVETSRFVAIDSLNVIGGNRAHAVNYEPIGSMRKFLEELAIDYQQYSFVDFGSGKGRVLLEAAAFPFRSVEGVEFSVELHAIAENNIRQYRYGKVRCGAIRSVLADAAEFEIPAVPLVLYFFNPFSDPVLKIVVDNIRRSTARNRRSVLIICAGSLMPKERFDCIPNIHVVWRRPLTTVYSLH
jgi:hypothetical protein